MTTCPDLSVWERLTNGHVSAEEATRLETHLATCAACRDQVDRLHANEHMLGSLREALAEPTVPLSGEAFETDKTAAGGRDGSLTGQTIDEYRVLRQVGRGGMGEVYQAVREGDGIRQIVALKVLRPGLDTEAVLHRFDLERQLLASLNHPNIARLYDAGRTAEGRPYFVMEYIEGRPLIEHADTERLTLRERLDLFRAVCAAVHYSHQNLVVHRDLKPGNILVTSEGAPKLVDFGIAKLINPQIALAIGDPTTLGLQVMTPEYASPEQVRGDPVSTVTDVYSLGVILYELVCGHRPYRIQRRVAAEIERIICEEDPERPSTASGRVDDDGDEPTSRVTPESVSRLRETHPHRLRRALAGDIDNIVLMAMRKEPRRRYASAEQLADDIERHIRGRPVRARRDTLGYRCAKFTRRNRVGVAVAIVFALLLAGGGAMIARQRTVAATNHARAAAAQEELQSMLVLIADADQVITLQGATQARFELLQPSLERGLMLLARDPQNSAMRRIVADLHRRVGDVLGGSGRPNLGHPADALRHYDAAMELLLELEEEHPDDLEVLHKRLARQIGTGNALRDDGKSELGLLVYRRTEQEARALREQHPEFTGFTRLLAASLQSIGDRVLDTGDVEGSVPLFRESLELRHMYLETVADDDTEKMVRAVRDLAKGQRRLAKVADLLGRPVEAERLYREALATTERAALLAPGNDRVAREIMINLTELAEALNEQPGRAEDALEIMTRVMDTANARARDDPSSVEARDDRERCREAYENALLAAQ